MKILIYTDTPSYSSETVEFKDKKFKIVASNGNAYSNLRIYAYTLNGDIALIANEGDIPNYKAVNYISDDHIRLRGNEKNILAAEKYIKAIY